MKDKIVCNDDPLPTTSIEYPGVPMEWEEFKKMLQEGSAKAQKTIAENMRETMSRILHHMQLHEDPDLQQILLKHGPPSQVHVSKDYNACLKESFTTFSKVHENRLLRNSGMFVWEDPYCMYKIRNYRFTKV